MTIFENFAIKYLYWVKQSRTVLIITPCKYKFAGPRDGTRTALSLYPFMALYGMKQVYKNEITNAT